MSTQQTLTQQEAWKNRAEALKDLPLLWKLLWEAAPGAVFTTVTLRVISGLTPLAMLYTAKQIIDLIAAAHRGEAISETDMWMWVGLEFALAAISQIIGRGIDYCDGIMGDRFSHSVGLKIMRHAGTLDLAKFEDPTFQDRLERARAQSTDRIGMLTSAGWLLQRGVMLLSLVAGIVVFSPWLLLVLIVSVVPSFLVESHFAFLGYTQAHAQTPGRRALEYFLKLGSSRESAKEVKVFALAPHLEGKYAGLSEEIVAQNRRLASRRMFWGGLFSVFAAAGYYGSYALVALSALHREITLGTFTFLVAAIAGANGHLQTMFSLFSGIADQSLFLRDLVIFFRETPLMDNSQATLPPPRPIRQGLEFENVTFRYPGSDRAVLDAISFRIDKGQRVALVGENGQGKTTIVKLISRLYEPTEGRILLDGIDIREYDVDELRKEIGVIFQDFIRYDMPARENIAVGNISQLHDDAALLEACQRSNSLDLLDRFPERLDQMLGRRFEGGVDLSGGEWQRLALARAYLRDAQILILDEPTAALDPMAEFEVFQKFAELTADKLAIFISHRFSSVRMADRILVLSNGVIAQDGSHDDLVQADGLYSNLFEVQAASYR